MRYPISEKTNEFNSAAPLCAIDGLSVREDEGKLRLQVTKTIRAGDPYMDAHFPDFTIFPGVFILEGLRQAVIAALGERDRQEPRISTVHSLRFSAPLLAGDQMILDATIEGEPAGKLFEVTALCRRSDGIAAAQLKVEFCHA